MRVYGALIVMVLLAAAAVLFLQSRDATRSVDSVGKVAESLRESGVVGSELNRDAAKRIISELRFLVDNPVAVEDNMAGLREIAAIAASWAKAAPSPSLELHLAVSIRAAADDLRSYGLEPAPLHLDRARSRLAEADKALLGQAGASTTTDAIRDQLQNLERSQQEKYQEINELGN